MDDIPLLVAVVVLVRVMTMLWLQINSANPVYYHNRPFYLLQFFFYRSFNTSNRGIHHTSLHGNIATGENTRRTHISPSYLTKHELITSAHMSSVRTNQRGLGNRESIWKFHQYLHWHHTCTRHSHIFQMT